MRNDATPTITRLRLTKAFTAVYRSGRWARGRHLSVGSAPNQRIETRLGLRTRRGLKGAVERNRLKRQLRTVIRTQRLALCPAVDVVIILHPAQIPCPTETLATELKILCKRLNILLPLR
ncbi:MAG: ribonuclease P protein component [Candidatus Omnitrophica bacterium]|nr:ribonuclease P protein component [Candidatus Omnitrophota bacterium]